ncbi:type II toxin-antitoxin system VapB family antitoxin [Vineibacter terrae]|uniref:type II toxin-antitoxin system VapB family antitoxin n=1 Tax=Vineibacter terrae TaxID=2586908 RepID=UPI002E349B1C|nr:type II toxin-antitoxin system VapB family antitoxin [Vineibacter terrae]HEX2886360.1 type II toxin-antitoxin system VapB family antitoxin [Vineibacter terrae]
MAFNVKDEKTDAAVRRLAQLTGRSLTDTVRLACENEYERLKERRPLSERLAAIADRAARYKRTGKKADKAFYDALSGNL